MIALHQFLHNAVCATPQTLAQCSLQRACHCSNSTIRVYDKIPEEGIYPARLRAGQVLETAFAETPEVSLRGSLGDRSNPHRDKQGECFGTARLSAYSSSSRPCRDSCRWRGMRRRGGGLAPPIRHGLPQRRKTAWPAAALRRMGTSQAPLTRPATETQKHVRTCCTCIRIAAYQLLQRELHCTTCGAGMVEAGALARCPVARVAPFAFLGYYFKPLLVLWLS
jgi:hypothetical protein